MTDFLAKAYLAMREKVKKEAVQAGTYENTSDTLTEFLKECAGNTVYTRNIPNGRGNPKPVGFISGPRTDLGRSIHVQWVLNERVLRISRPQFNKFLALRKVSTSNVMRGLKKHFNATETKANLAAGIPYNGGREMLLVIPVSEDTELWRMMHSYTPVEEQQAMSEEEAVIKETGITQKDQSGAV